MAVISRSKAREFQVEQLVRVLDPRYKLYKFGMSRKGEVVYMSTHDYLTRMELSIVIEMGHLLQQALDLKHVGIQEVGTDEITKRRLKRKEYLDDLEHVASQWIDSGDSTHFHKRVHGTPPTGGADVAGAEGSGHVPDEQVDQKPVRGRRTPADKAIDRKQAIDG